MSELLKLAERCEKATGPDRELDGSIWWATRPPQEIEDIWDRTGYVRQCIERDGSAGKALAQFYDSANKSCLAIVAFRQSYTASLDAAMTLVPEGLHVTHAGEARFMTRSPAFAATVEEWATQGSDEDVIHTYPMRRHGVAQTLALAICAAALRSIDEGGR